MWGHIVALDFVSFFKLERVIVFRCCEICEPFTYMLFRWVMWSFIVFKSVLMWHTCLTTKLGILERLRMSEYRCDMGNKIILSMCSNHFEELFIELNSAVACLIFVRMMIMRAFRGINFLELNDSIFLIVRL